MLRRQPVSLDQMVDTLKAAAESSRLRILLLLSRGDLTVSDLTQILGQSQPRVSRHLKLLLDSGLIDRYQEGSWAYFCLADSDRAREFLHGIVTRIDEGEGAVERDLERLDSVKRRRQDRAADYFSRNAESWDRIRSLHAPDDKVEGVLKHVIGTTPIQSMLDLGTGTGRLLELFAPIYRRGIGLDLSREMLAVARANLDRAEVNNAQVRLGDLYAPPVDRESVDLITMHQVLHYLEEPGRAIVEAARLLRPAGRLVIVDFAPHDLEFLREEHAHLRLGFTDRQIEDWLSEAGLENTDNRALAFGTEGGLTVKIWAARDPRLLVADQETNGLYEERVTA